jgi:hypothetical protein
VAKSDHAQDHSGLREILIKDLSTNKMLLTADQHHTDFLSAIHDERGHILHSFHFNYLPPYFGSWDSAVGTANGYGLDGRWVGVRFPVGASFYSSPRRPVLLGPTQPPIRLVPRALSPGAERQECEADHSSPTTAEIQNTRINTSTPPYVFMVLCLISSMFKLRRSA